MKNLKENTFRPSNAKTPVKKQDLWTRPTIGVLMASKSPLLWRSLSVLLTLLASCTTTPAEPVATETAAQVPATETLPALATFTPPPFAFPTATATFASKPIPVSTMAETYPLDNLRMAYIVDGDLYVQNGSNPPKQPSDSGIDWRPMFSDDGEKIIFYRGKGIHDYNSIFSVNADGSQVREIISTAWLDTLGTGTKAGHLAFVPNTHQILFNTYLCPEYDPSSDSGCTVGLFLADSNTGKLREIMIPTLGGYLPWYGDSHWLGNFSVSPDGKSLSVAHAGQIDILSMDGKVLYRNIMEYLPGMPIELYPKVYWFPDSSGLIAALPAEEEYYPWVISGDPAYAIWRYTFDSNVATQISLYPPLSWAHMESNDVVSISPNREWVIYFTEDYKLYKGNLLDGKTDLLLPYGWFLPMQWSSDSTHFANNGSSVEPILGSVDTPPGYIFRVFIGWIDAKRFIYVPNSAENQENIQLLIGEIEGEIILSYESNIFVPSRAPYPYFFAFTGK